MTLELAQKRLSLLPQFIQTGNGEPRKGHWLGNKEPVERERDQNQRGEKDRAPKQPDTRGYRDLASITLGEVNDAYQFFESQLLPTSPDPSWVAANLFCMVDIRRRRGDHRPPALFGRVRACYPSDGYIDNITDMEMHFPTKKGKPEAVLLRNEDIHADKPVRSFGVRVKFRASREEIDEFKQFGNLFLASGLIPEYSEDFGDLLELREADKESYAWLHVIGSRWFAAIPESVQPEIRESLKKLIRWDKLLFNYHPQRLFPKFKTLIMQLDFNYGFTDHFLVAPDNPMDTVRIVASAFDRIFQQPIQ